MTIYKKGDLIEFPVGARTIRGCVLEAIPGASGEITYYKGITEGNLEELANGREFLCGIGRAKPVKAGEGK